MMKTKALLHRVAKRVPQAGLALGLALASAASRAVSDLPGGPAVNQLDLHPPVTRIAADQQWLHNFVMIICVLIFLGVFGVMFYSILKHRKSKGAKAANFHESTTVEIVWTIVPFIIVILMALPATRVVVAMKDTSASDITIKATGIQWKWGYDYLNGEGAGIGFVSTLDNAQREMSNSGKPSGDDYLLKVDNPLVVPVDKKIRIITTANDVIHAWMVPAFGVKQDAIPGFVRDTWFRAEKTGDFYGQCAELCGKEHAYMPIHVKVLSQADYTTWVAGKQKEMAAAPGRSGQGLGTAGPVGSRRKGLCSQLRGLPPAHRQGRRPDQAARRRRRGARRRQGQADRCTAERPEQRRDAVVEAAQRHRNRGGDHVHQEQLVEQDRAARAAVRSAGRPQVRSIKNKLEGSPMSAVLDPHGHGHAHDHDHHDHGAPAGWRRWLYATNHKDIGTMYLLFSFAMLMVGGMLAMLIRLELFQPGLQFVNPQLFNQLTTMHGLIMVFGAIMPGFVGFANWMIPLQIGAADMAFARMNNFSFWLLIPAALMLVGSFFMPGGAPAAGWTLYAPLTLQMGPSMDAGIFAMHIMGASSIMGSINIIVTVLNMRAPGMTLMKMPLFCWTWLITAYLLIAVMPVLAGAITMTLTDRHFGTSFFNPAGGGDPVMYQHIFWFFGHPEVYIMILPAFGIVSAIIPAFARKRLFGYTSMVYATASIAILSFIVWAHHMFTTGMPVTGQLFFMYATMLIAVPTGVKIFNWIATMWRGSMTFETPMLFAVGFIFVFTMGGFTGLILSAAPVDIQLQDTYYVVAHFHYVLVAGSLYAMFAGVYYWGPKWTGVMYSETRGKIHFWGSLIAFNITFFPMHFLGLAGMPRRYADYPLAVRRLQHGGVAGSLLVRADAGLFLPVRRRCR